MVRLPQYELVAATLKRYTGIKDKQMSEKIHHPVKSLSRSLTKKLKKVRETKQRKASQKIIRDHRQDLEILYSLGE